MPSECTCDACEQTWHEEFICKKCSGPKVVVVEDWYPHLYWEGDGDDGEIREQEEVMLLTICGNCCKCNAMGIKTEEATDANHP